MRQLTLTLSLLAAMTLPGVAGEWADRLPQLLYDGALRDAAADMTDDCDGDDAEACFALGLHDFIVTYEDTARALYRHGATTPTTPAMSLLLGTDLGTEATPPDPRAVEPLTYDGLVAILQNFVAGLDGARARFETAGNGAAFVIPIDPLRARLDLDGDGTAGEGETLGVIVNTVAGLDLLPQPPAFDLMPPDPGAPKTKTKNKAPADTTIGFDNADAIWLAGYSTVAATPADFILAHDFSAFFDAYLHRVFPDAGLPMAPYGEGRDDAMIMGPESDAFIADLVAALHTADFPVTDTERLAGVRERLLAITTLSRRNWELIMVETDDNRELVPSPTQTSLVPGRDVTLEVVNAWRTTLDRVDAVLNGDLLLPHWRFEQGFDLSAYFETATRTDFVMLLTGHDAVPFLGDGPIASAEDFAEANRVFGEDWPLFAIWFN
jgi:hypothetical protein